MILKIFSVYDSKATAYIAPFFLPATAMALRNFRDCGENPEHAFNRHPGDYTLYELGEFDDGTGTMDTYDQAINLGHPSAPPQTMQQIRDSNPEYFEKKASA